tara:strand:- start:608 stop:1606 length:999 start_codon:yes stop_codon:yes gene_type:complete
MKKSVSRNCCHFFLALACLVASLNVVASGTNESATPDTKQQLANINNSVLSLNINFATNIPEAKKAYLSEWVIHGKQALRLVYGKLPFDDFVTLIKASNQSVEAVPWGEVNRYSPPEVTLVVNLNSTLDSLKADWTIYHEYSHLLIPYDAGDSRWLSEGLASYYQNIIQARAGMFDEKTMWKKLYDGFERGNKQQNYAEQKLSQVSDNIGQNQNYMRIYWSGALYWLKADIALRTLSKNSNKSYSLDSVLKQLQACCFHRQLSSRKLIQKLDQLSESNIFSALFADFSASYAIPNYLTLLNSLGVKVKNHQISLDNHAQLSQERQAIFTGKL